MTTVLGMPYYYFRNSLILLSFGEVIMHFKLPSFKVSILFILITFLSIPYATAQANDLKALIAQAGGQSAGDVGSSAANQEAIEKLRRMSTEEIEVLDNRLYEALILYYDRKFAAALPIFREIAGKVETMDIMFWIGTSAMKVGQTQLAIQNFKKMLAIDPQMHRVRLELAATYFSMGRHEDARRELAIVQAASPPPGVQKNIAKLLGAIEERSKKLFWNLRMSQGYLWDDNISSGPEREGYEALGITPSATSLKLRDEAAVTNLSGNVLYDFGESKGLMWNTAATFYNKAYFDYSQFNYLVVDVTTGPWLAGRRDILKIPFGYTQSEYGSDRLSYYFHVDPNYEHHFSQYFSLKGLYSFSNEIYNEDSRSDLDNKKHRYELEPSLYFDNRKHILSATAGYENHNAESDLYSYADPYFAFSYFARFPTNTELFLRYHWSQRNYKDKPPFLFNPLNRFRDDKRNSITAVISQGFLKYFFASFSFYYIENDSNLELYDYDKTTYTLSVGCRF